MVPSSGAILNSGSPLISAWEKNGKENLKWLEAFRNSRDMEEVFETLSEWNSYLEKVVPSLKGLRL